MNNGLYLQKIKIMLYPMNSFQFFEIGNKDVYNEEEIMTHVFQDIREGFYTTKRDSFNMIVEKYWNEDQCNMQKFSFEDCHWGKYIFDTCRKIARKYFYLKDGTLYVDGNKNERYIDFIENGETFDEILEVGENHNNKFQWYYLKHMIDVDSLTAAYMADNELVSYKDYYIWKNPVQTTNGLLDKMLEKGMAETHLHLGAGKDFLSIWVDLMNDRNIQIKSFTKELSKISIKTNRGYVKLENYIRITKIMRVLLAKYLEDQRYSKIQEMIKSLDNAIKDQLANSGDGDFKKSFEKLCCEYMSGEKLDSDEMINYQKYFDILKEFIDSDFNETSNHEDVINDRDILKRVFTNVYRDAHFQVSAEHILLTEGMYMIKKKYEESYDDNDWFTSVFTQYIRMKNVVYKYFIQQVTSGKGLDIFSEYYGNQKAFGSENFYEDVLTRQISNGNMKKLEVRIGTNANEEKVRSNLIELFKGYKNVLLKAKNDRSLVVPQIGIVYHFIKRGVEYHNSCSYNNINFDIDEYSEEKKQIKRYEEEAKVISKLRSTIPFLDKYIVGIDAASKENDTEPFIFKRAYELLRKPQNVRKLNNGIRGFKKDIGFTFHVGEEFRDIISGLRHVDEVVEYLRFRNGDRLGHGIVLGIDVDKWAATNQVVYIPVSEYLDNLLWEWSLYISDREYRDYDNISYIENQIMELAERIFGQVNGLTVRDFYKNYQKKMMDFHMEECPYSEECFIQELTQVKHESKDKRYKSNIRNGYNKCWDREKIFAAINCKYFMKELNKVVAINMNSELVEKYKKLQKYMRGKISKRGIIIEVNPTSNIMIGDFSAYEDYHILEMSSPTSEEVIVTINTDDPVVFSTMLKDEFALIYDIVIKSNKYSSKEVIQWLNKIRQNGVDYSFIEDRCLSIEEIIYEVEVIVEKLISYELYQ